MQDYIENENGRLEREQQFWSKEIVVKIEYKYCPNLTIIDTPGEWPNASSFLLPESIPAFALACVSLCEVSLRCHRSEQGKFCISRQSGPAGV